MSREVLPLPDLSRKIEGPLLAGYFGSRAELHHALRPVYNMITLGERLTLYTCDRLDQERMN